MALQEQHIAFKFVGGIETKLDDQTVPGTRLLALENGVFTKGGSIRKRFGYTALSKAIDGSVSTISGAQRLGKRDNELLLFTNNRCYSKQTGVDQWTDTGAAICAVGTDRPAVHTGSAQTMPDHATNGGVTVYAWEDSRGGVWWTAVDAERGTIYRAPVQADANGQRPRCVAAGEMLHVYYAVPAQRTVMVLVINPSTPSASVTPAILINDLDSTTPSYDVCPTTRADGGAAVVWYEFATTNIRAGYITPGGVLGTPASGYPTVGRHALSLHASSPLTIAYLDVAGTEYLAVAYVRSDNTGRVFYMTPAPSTAGGSVIMYAVATSVQRVAATLLLTATSEIETHVVYEEAAAQASQRYCVVNSKTGTAAPGTERTLRSVGLAARGFTISTDAFAMFVHDTTYFNTYVTLRLSDFAPVGRQLAGSANGAPARSHLPSVHVSDSIAKAVLPYKTRVKSVNNDKFTESALRLVTMGFANDDSHQTAQLGRGLTMAGACPLHYDGRTWTEQGFHFGPEYIPTPAKAGGGSMTTGATYLYKCWYEWTDAQGEIHRGPESIGTTVVMGGADTQVTFSLPTLRVTQKENVRICLARSLPGDDTRLWRVTSLDPTTSGAAANGYVANNTAADTASFVDRMSDTDLQKQEPIYTTGGILSNDPVSLGSIVVAGKNRLFFTDASNGSVVRFSQRIAPGFGVEIGPELQHDVDPFGGDITALAVMDDVLYAFKSSAIFAFNGDGPLENGDTSLGGFSASQIITSHVGCTDPSSIALTPAGLMFKSTKGIHLLDRSRNVTYVGAPAEAYNSQTVRRASVMPDRNQVVFLTDSGKTLLFDYLFQQWSTFTNHEGYDSIVVDDTYYYLRTNSTVFQETIDGYSDAGARITLLLETAWLHLHEHLQGFQRFWKLLLLGERYSPHQLGIQYRLSYNEQWSDPWWLDATGDTSSTGWLTGDGANPIGEDPITGSAYGEGAYGDGPYGGTGPDVYQWRFGIHEAGQAIQFRFQDFEKSGLAGASYELTEMTIVGGVDRPDTRPFSGARST